MDFKKYTILGACNPHFAYHALEAEDKLGVMLPCNVVVIEQNSGIEICAIDPRSMMGQLGNKELIKISDQVTDKLQSVFKKL